MARDHVNALATRDRLHHLLGLLGVRTSLQVVTFGETKAIAMAPLWDVDAQKLTDALAKVPEMPALPPQGGAAVKCRHTGKLKDSPEGKRCAACGALIYPKVPACPRP